MKKMKALIASHAGSPNGKHELWVVKASSVVNSVMDVLKGKGFKMVGVQERTKNAGGKLLYKSGARVCG